MTATSGTDLGGGAGAAGVPLPASVGVSTVDVLLGCIDPDTGAKLAEELRSGGLRVAPVVLSEEVALDDHLLRLSRGGVVFIEGLGQIPTAVDRIGALPHVTCVALVELEEVRSALSRGVDDVLPRPWTAEGLRARVEVARARATTLDLELAPWSLHAPDAIVVLDGAGTVLAWSLAAVDCLGYEARDIVGRSFEAMLAEEFGWVFQELAEGSTESLGGVRIRRRGGDTVSCTIHVARWRVGSGRRIGLRVEETVDVSDELMRIASYPELNPNPTFEIGGDNDLMYLNPALLALDAELRDGLVAQALGLLAAEPVFVDGVFKQEVVSGERWFLLVIHATTEWQSVRVYSHEITERKLAELSLIEANDTLDRKVKERTVDLSREVEVRKRAEEAALAANEAKSAFLATMSHELRTPLNAVIGYAELLSEEFGESQASDDLRKIVLSAHHLLGLINDILDLSKIEAGRVAISPEMIRLDETIESVVASIGALAMARGNRVVLDLDRECASLWSDPSRLRQILLNLCGNAAKFTSDGEIRIELRRLAGARSIEIVVADTGIGIASEKVERIFEPFTQADSSTAREYGGTGLGLAISRKLAQLLGGSLRATSQLGVGSRFILRLPYASSPQESGE